MNQSSKRPLSSLYWRLWLLPLALIGLACAPSSPPKAQAAPVSSSPALVSTATVAPATLTATVTPRPSSTPTTTPTPTATRITTVPPTAATTYAVKSGDTLASIAPRFNVSVAALQTANGITDARLLRVGQTLRIPSSTTAAPVQVSTATAVIIKPLPSIPTATPFLQRTIPYPGNGGGPTRCRDGSVSGSSGRGTCSHHGGIAR